MSSGSACNGSPAPAPVARLLLLFIDVYRLTLSPFVGGFCRFVPSCSAYAEEAVLRHGARRGVVLALRRLSRCHPFRPGGLDPVP